MRKLLYLIPLCLFVFGYIHFHTPTIVYAASCVTPGSNNCSDANPCCSPVANQRYVCNSVLLPAPGHGGGGTVKSTCVQEKLGDTCGDVGNSCGLNGNKSCCSQNASGQAISCNITTHKCELSNTNKFNTCAAENAKCGLKNNTSCCSTTDTNKNPLSCVDGSGKPTDSDGTCKFATLQDTKANQTVVCKCTSPDLYSANSNGFTCNGMGSNDDGKAYNIFCSDSDQACVNGADKSIFLNNDNGLVMVRGNNADFDKNFKGHTAIGVTCEKKVKKPDPPPPSPPCILGGWVAGQCTGFVTALGNLDTDSSGFTLRLFSILLSFSGGIALLLIIRAGFNLITSQGKPEQVQNGRDQLIAAIVGLTFLIFSLVLLEVIGYDILRIPGFGKGTVGAGGTCTVGGNQCTAGYVCNYSGSQGQCVKNTAGAKGTTCTVGVSGQCQAGLTCQYNGSGGTCQ